MNLFELKNISKEHCLGDVKFKSLHHIEMVIESGKFYTLWGPEGAGKSRILFLLGLMDQPTTGEIFYKGINVAGMDDKQMKSIRVNEVGYIPQNFYLNNTFTLLDNISLVSKLMGQDNWLAQEKAEFWLHKVGLDHKMNGYPLELNKLEFKKAAIAREMVKKPEILLADELYLDLQPEEIQEVVDLLLEINKTYQTSIVQTSRIPGCAKFCDTIYQVKDGVSYLAKSSKSATAA